MLDTIHMPGKIQGQDDLTIGAAGGAEALVGILPYAAVAVPLYVYTGRMRN